MNDYLICTEIYDDNTQNDLQEINNSAQKAVFIKNLLWDQNSTITIGFFNDGYGIERTQINDTKNIDPLEYTISKLTPVQGVKRVVQDRIQPLVNLKLQFLDDPRDAIIRISFVKEKGTWSNNGTSALKVDKDDVTMNFAWLDVATILHEFGHFLGMTHEHQGPYSNIQWNKPLLYKYYKTNYGYDQASVDEKIIKQHKIYNVTSSDFDPLSIMLYFFDKRLTTNNLGTPKNNRLSGYDVLWITSTYPVTNGISPEDFYFETYGISLADALAESDKLGEKYPKRLTWWQILLIILGSIFVIGLFFLIQKIYRNKNSYKRLNYDDDKQL